MKLGCLLVACGALVGCAAPSSSSGADGPPLPPGKSDGSDYSVTGGRAWYLVGNDLTPGNDRLELAIEGPGETSVIDLYIDGELIRRADRVNGAWSFDEDVTGLAVGEHSALLAADGANVAFNELRFVRSHPLYVAVSNDWDQSDQSASQIERQERLHTRHPELVITHFVGPYTFTDPNVSTTRQQELVNWLINLRETEGDEIGLHVHPRCSFVEAAGVTCRSTPSFAYASGDSSGYTVRLDAYTESELVLMFNKATELFLANGLNAPTSFRAGGWTAEAHVLSALSQAGHVVDTSGCNWSRLEEWISNPGASLYQWNMEHWSTITETSQPYYPNVTNMLSDAA
ncbi:MAG: hypothetical protein AB7R00_06500, partial [Kofleriaceae bacterium]